MNFHYFALVSPSLVLLMTSCSSQREDTMVAVERDLISKCLVAIHQELLELSSRFPQISNVHITDNKVSFYRGDISYPNGKAGPLVYSEKNACSMSLRLQQSLKEKLRGTADFGRFYEKAHLHTSQYFSCNPQSENYSEIRKQVANITNSHVDELVMELEVLGDRASENAHGF